VITDKMLSARRPGEGISAALVDEVCGKKAARDLERETMLSHDDFL